MKLKQMKKLISILTLFILFSFHCYAINPISTATKYEPQPFDIINYQADFDIPNAPEPIINAVSIIRAEWIGSPDTSLFYFHLNDLTIDSIYYNNSLIEASENENSDGKYFSIAPPDGKPGDIFYIRIHYHGEMKSEGGFYDWGGMHRSGDLLYNLGVGFYNPSVSAARFWLACYDHPSDKASMQFNIKVPKEFRAVSNGSGEVISENETYKVYQWRHELPIATNLMCLAVGKLEEIDLTENPELPILVYANEKQLGMAESAFAFLRVLVGQFENYFGKYPFDKVGYLLTPLGSMEHQTLIALDSALLDRYPVQPDLFTKTVGHELAHQWFGGLVTPWDYRDAWLSEGFATFCEPLMDEISVGKNNYLDRMLSFINDYISNISKRERVFPLYDFPRKSPSSNYPATIYRKGALVLGMMRYELGDSIFFVGVRNYLNKYKFGNASTEDLKQVLEEISGKDLDYFFNQWVYGYGWPRIEIELKRYPSSGKTAVTLTQTQPEEYGIYTNLPVEIGFTNDFQQFEYQMVRLNGISETFYFDDYSEYQYIWLNRGPSLRVLMQQGMITTSVENATELNQPLIYPLPADDLLKVHYQPKSESITMQIVNMNGELILDLSPIESGTGGYEIFAGNLPVGMYYLLTIDGVSRFATKFSIMR